MGSSPEVRSAVGRYEPKLEKAGAGRTFIGSGPTVSCNSPFTPLWNASMTAPDGDLLGEGGGELKGKGVPGELDNAPGGDGLGESVELPAARDHRVRVGSASAVQLGAPDIVRGENERDGDRRG
jgi:hypothetical protein